MNAVHPRHSSANYDSLRHFIITFHDSTFECVARDFDSIIAEIQPNEAIPQMVEILGMGANQRLVLRRDGHSESFSPA